MHKEHEKTVLHQPFAVKQEKTTIIHTYIRIHILKCIKPDEKHLKTPPPMKLTFLWSMKRRTAKAALEYESVTDNDLIT